MTKQQTNASRWLPVGERVLLKPKERKAKENKTTSGIIIPDTAASEEETRKTSPIAVVVAVSPDILKKFGDQYLLPNEIVIYARSGVDTLKDAGETYVLAPIENILAKKVHDDAE